MTSESRLKKFLFLQRKAPCGSLQGQELLDAALMTAAFEQKLSLLFMDEGVFILQKDRQSDSPLDNKLVKTLGNLSSYGVDNVYVDKQSMTDRGINESNLLIEAKIVDTKVIQELLDEQDVILST